MVITNFNLAKRSVQIFSPSRGGELAMGNWTLVINRTKENDELLCYKFNEYLSVPPRFLMTLWSGTAVEGSHCPPGNIVLHNSQEEDEFIWTLSRNDLTCILFDENMNVGWRAFQHGLIFALLASL